MQKIKILLLIAVFIDSFASAQVGINTDAPHPSAILDVDVTNLPANGKLGFLPPRMVTANLPTSPALGLVVYNTTDNCIQWWDGAFWFNPCDGSSTPIPNPNLFVTFVSYNGQSLINTQGIGYNGENVPASSTITVSLDNSSTEDQVFGLVARDPATGLQYSARGTVPASTTNFMVTLENNQVAVSNDFFGIITMSLQGADNNIDIMPRIDIKSLDASGWVEGVDFMPVTYGGQVWMDRNLGAARPATSATDPLSYGNFYQWGRNSDGHERSVFNGAGGNGTGLFGTTNVLFTTATPMDNRFVTNSTVPNDWVDQTIVTDPSRWTSTPQGPCPTGYRVPTQADWQTALSVTPAWTNATDANSSALLIPIAGSRVRSSGDIFSVGSRSRYWTATTDLTGAVRLDMSLSSAGFIVTERAQGHPVRCIKN